jgi:hypothetical protein
MPFEAPKINLLNIKNIQTNKGKTYKAKTAVYTYNERVESNQKYSMKEIEREMNIQLAALRRMDVNGWCSLSVAVNGKYFSTPVNISFTRNVDVSSLLFQYFDDYYQKKGEENPLYGDETKHTIDSWKIYFNVFKK